MSDEEVIPENELMAVERIASAFEVIADTLTAWFKLEVQRFEKQWPVRREPRDAEITTSPDPEEQLKKDQGASEERIEEWIGLREQEFIRSTEGSEE